MNRQTRKAREASQAIVQRWIDEREGEVHIDQSHHPRGCNMEEIKQACADLGACGIASVRKSNQGSALVVATRRSVDKSIATIEAWQKSPTTDPPPGVAIGVFAFGNVDRIAPYCERRLQELRKIRESLRRPA